MRRKKATVDTASAVAKAGMVRIGISGWRYAGWRGVFYSPKLPQRRELEYASREFSTIEINGTFYSMQRPGSFARWAEDTPDDFVFGVKGGRFITHMKKLRVVEEALANFFAQGLLRLGAKLGPILWQFPPNLRYNGDLFYEFFKLLPGTMEAAAQLAEAHGPKLRGRAWTEVDAAAAQSALRYAVEIRHESFAAPEFIELLRRHNIALVVADTVEWPLLMDVTSDFVYCRLHGSELLYSSGYDDHALEVWADRVAAWADGSDCDDGRFAHASRCEKRGGRDVYVYFDNDAKVRAPLDAKGLRERVAKRIGSARVWGAATQSAA